MLAFCFLIHAEDALGCVVHMARRGRLANKLGGAEIASLLHALIKSLTSTEVVRVNLATNALTHLITTTALSRVGVSLVIPRSHFDSETKCVFLADIYCHYVLEVNSSLIRFNFRAKRGHGITREGGCASEVTKQY